MTKHPVCILETFKVIVKGRVFLARAKKLFTWNPSFTAIKEKEYASEDESIHVSNNNEFHQHINEEDLGDKYDSEEEGVPETVFGSNASSYRKESDNIAESANDFGEHAKSDNIDVSANDFGKHAKNTDKDLMPEPPTNFSTKVMNDSQNIPEENHSVSVGSKSVNNGGSVLGVMEEFIRIGQAMGYSMEGSVKDLTDMIRQQGENNIVR
uniref:RNA-directed DNA polymerase, eukaryota n=1 Tax=Tanacetum cinerariifolium TaxID=118510 RepID=A0A699R8C1_TANCI|nr:hypothetical protein [Tanacetum cinerariifolium]